LSRYMTPACVMLLVTATLAAPLARGEIYKCLAKEWIGPLPEFAAPVPVEQEKQHWSSTQQPATSLRREK
jgi:hypothetical protein